MAPVRPGRGVFGEVMPQVGVRRSSATSVLVRGSPGPPVFSASRWFVIAAGAVGLQQLWRWLAAWRRVSGRGTGDSSLQTSARLVAGTRGTLGFSCCGTGPSNSSSTNPGWPWATSIFASQGFRLAWPSSGRASKGFSGNSGPRVMSVGLQLRSHWSAAPRATGLQLHRRWVVIVAGAVGLQQHGR